MREDEPDDSYDPDAVKKWDDENQDIVEKFMADISIAEDKLSSALPDGYYVKIEDH
jgi:hypothetical protein